LEDGQIECAFCGEARPLYGASEFSDEIYRKAM
jgi:hypothetical protein